MHESISLSFYLSLSVCVCACVCEERERGGGGEHIVMMWAGKSEEARHMSSKGYALSLKYSDGKRTREPRAGPIEAEVVFQVSLYLLFCAVYVITEY